MNKYIFLILVLITSILRGEDFIGEPYYYRNIRIEYGDRAELIRIELIGFGKNAEIYYSTIERRFMKHAVREKIDLSEFERERFYIIVNNSQFLCEKILGSKGRLAKAYWWDSETLDNPGPNREKWEEKMKEGLTEYYKHEHKTAK